jgi:pimeloyl-ACP methyl ester carboxylesterase
VTGAVAGGRIPLVLLPGTLCDAELWQHQTQHLEDIAAPSVGDVGRDESIAGMAERVLEAVPSRFALAGLSMGGIVAFGILRRAPERVVALALLNTNPSFPDDNQIALWHEEIEMAESGRFEEIVEERWIPSVLEAGGSRGGSLRDAIRRMAHRVGPKSYVRQLQAQIARPDSWSSLAAITCPTLVLGGRQDTMCSPALHEAMAAAIPNARLAIIEDCGHLSTLEQPEMVTALLRNWLEGMIDCPMAESPGEASSAPSLVEQHA